MKAIRLHHRGGPEAFVYEEAPQPHPGADEVLVRVHAAAVTPTGVSNREGATLRPAAELVRTGLVAGLAVRAPTGRAQPRFPSRPVWWPRLPPPSLKPPRARATHGNHAFGASAGGGSC
jgi:hypothetical protein